MNKKNLAILVCIILAVIATKLSKMQHYVGGPMIGLLFGILIVNFMPSIDKDFKAGTTFAGKKFLNIGIILAGGTLNFAQVIGYGAKALPLIIANICFSFGVAYLVGKKLGVTKNTSTLVGGGSCICGGTAIATLAGIIKAKEEEIAYAMTAIFLFDILAAVSYPYIATALGLTVNQFGFLAGCAINDTSSVAAAEATYNALHGLGLNLAITVKLTRTTMLIVLAVIFTILRVKEEAALNNGQGAEVSLSKTIVKVFPMFILWFLVMALLNTLGVFNAISTESFKVGKLLSTGYKFFVTVALAGVGFKIKFVDLFTKGLKPIVLGGCTWAAVAISTFAFIFIFAGYVG